ncbi:MAG: DUF1295 domain-containing protein [Bacteroidota bacterium]
MSQRQIIFSLFTVLIVAFLLGLAASQHGQQVAGVPIFLICVGVAFMVNGLAFIPAYLLQTEKFYDLIGSGTFLSMVILAVSLSEQVDIRATLVSLLVSIWTIRLGGFLYMRIKKAGKDERFDTITPNPLRFLNAWALQALWAVFTAAPALIVITADKRVEADVFLFVGLLVWVAGFSLEVVADRQKRKFRAAPANQDRFIQSGLWAHSRHPNYLGEILLWVGITLMALPVFSGWQWVSLLSPVFVWLLLTRVSGIPMLERKADKKWGGKPDYERYKLHTPVLLPWIQKKKTADTTY